MGPGGAPTKAMDGSLPKIMVNMFHTILEPLLGPQALEPDDVFEIYSNAHMS